LQSLSVSASHDRTNIPVEKIQAVIKNNAKTLHKLKLTYATVTPEFITALTAWFVNLLPVPAPKHPRTTY
jgi:hypothetical protein